MTHTYNVLLFVERMIRALLSEWFRDRNRPGAACGVKQNLPICASFDKGQQKDTQVAGVSGVTAPPKECIFPVGVPLQPLPSKKTHPHCIVP